MYIHTPVCTCIYMYLMYACMIAYKDVHVHVHTKCLYVLVAIIISCRALTFCLSPLMCWMRQVSLHLIYHSHQQHYIVTIHVIETRTRVQIHVQCADNIQYQRICTCTVNTVSYNT